MLKLLLEGFLSLIVVLGTLTTERREYNCHSGWKRLSYLEITPTLLIGKASASTISIRSFLLLVSLPATSCLRNLSTEGLFSNVLMLPSMLCANYFVVIFPFDLR